MELEKSDSHAISSKFGIYQGNDLMIAISYYG